MHSGTAAGCLNWFNIDYLGLDYLLGVFVLLPSGIVVWLYQGWLRMLIMLPAKKKVYWQYCHIILSVLFSNTEHYAYISIFSFWHNPNNYLPFFLTRKQNKAPDRFFLLRGHLIICEPRSQLQYCIQSYTESSQLQYFRLYLLHLILQFYTAHSVWEEFHFHICFINLNCSFSFKRVSV